MKVCGNCLKRGDTEGHAHCRVAGGYVPRKQSACSCWTQNPRCPKQSEDAEVKREQ